MGYDLPYIEKYANFAKQNTTDSFRIEVYNTMLCIVKGKSNGEDTTK